MRKHCIQTLVATAFLSGAALAAAAGPAHTATVLETMNSGGYTYVQVDEDGVVYWAAAPAAAVSVGDRVSFSEQMKMHNFTSRTLDRTFPELLFVDQLIGGSGATEPTAAPPMPASVSEAQPLSGPIEKADGGYTISEVFAAKDELKGKTVKVRGQVVKVSRNIMGLNWIHLSDGSGTEGSDKLIFRSPTETAEVGSVVTAQGIVDTDKDFGFGYQYAVLVDDSEFSE